MNVKIIEKSVVLLRLENNTGDRDDSKRKVSFQCTTVTDSQACC